MDNKPETERILIRARYRGGFVLDENMERRQLGGAVYRTDHNPAYAEVYVEDEDGEEV